MNADDADQYRCKDFFLIRVIRVNPRLTCLPMNTIDALIDELDRLRASRDDAWQIPRAEGDLLYHIALSMRAKTIVEVGTSYGFSGLFWAKALQQTGGQLHTID